MIVVLYLQDQLTLVVNQASTIVQKTALKI